MTKDEAIKWLDYKSGDIYDHVFYGDEAPEWEDYEYEAFRMAIEALERKRGEWMPVTNGRGGYECSECHSYAPLYQSGDDNLSNFCPNCGADMRGDEDE